MVILAAFHSTCSANLARMRPVDQSTLAAMSKGDVQKPIAGKSHAETVHDDEE